MLMDIRGSRTPAANIISGLLYPEDILLDLDVTSKEELFDAIGRHLQHEHGIAAESVTAGLSRREKAGSTGLGEGVAIPHARVTNLVRPRVIFARLRLALDFDAPDGRPVADILVLLVPKQATQDHLNILAEAAQIFTDRAFRERLKSSRQALEIKGLFDSWSAAARPKLSLKR
jgi:PTS system nitrogen regulatory IIA component